jgi:hypothetical protein
MHSIFRWLSLVLKLLLLVTALPTTGQGQLRESPARSDPILIELYNAINVTSNGTLIPTMHPFDGQRQHPEDEQASPVKTTAAPNSTPSSGESDCLIEYLSTARDMLEKASKHQGSALALVYTTIVLFLVALLVSTLIICCRKY